jgi:pseudomonalisin
LTRAYAASRTIAGALALAVIAVLALATPAGAPAARPSLRALRNDYLSALNLATRTGDASATRQVRIGIAVGHPDPSGEQAYLHALYDPASPDYHRFLTPAQYASRFGVTRASASQVRSWIASAGLHVDFQSGARDYLLASGTIAQVERLTNTTIGAYRFAGASFIANDAPPRIPANLPVFSILGLNTYQRFHTMQEEGNAAAQPPATGIGQATPSIGDRTPQQLWNIYKQPPEHTGQGVSVAILGEGATDSVIKDLHTFDKNNKLAELPVTVVHTPTNGKFDDTSGNGEWNIDMQAVHGMAPGIAKEVLYFAPSLADTDLVGSTATWVNDPSGPPIMNASLGECEVSPLNPTLNNQAFYPINGNENQQSTPVSQGLSNSSEPAQGMLLQQAVMEGRTFFASSGDGGSSCAALYPALNGVLNEGVPLTEDPADQPFAVGVGGTVLYADSTDPTANRLIEYAWTHSGGNASPFITAPAYQHDVPNLTRTCVSDPNGGTSNTGQLCRGVPDVAALSGDVVSNGYAIVSDGQASSGGGTSLSSPLWAGMWARVVGTAPAGSSGYGFANEAIYKIAKDPVRYARSFNDVTVGSNGLNTAQPGYDYVTGFGTPNVASLITDVQAVAPPVAASGTTPVGSSSGGAGERAPHCADHRAPVSRYTGKRVVGRGRVSLSGKTSDRGCGPRGRGAVRRVQISIARTGRHGCSFVDASGRLTPARACRRPILLPAKGHNSWSFSMRVHLPPGNYRVVARGTDTAGNKERPRKGKNTLKLRIR